jgi:hypothetical protein
MTRHRLQFTLRQLFLMVSIGAVVAGFILVVRRFSVDPRVEWFRAARQASWGLTGASFKQTYIQSLHAPEGTIRIWFDRQEPTLTVRRTGPDMGQLNPSPEELRRGFYGSEKLEDGRVLSFRCLTETGEHGTMAFEIDGEPFDHDEKPFQLGGGGLFLVKTKGGQVEVKQLLIAIGDEAVPDDLDIVAQVDARIAQFIADAASSDGTPDPSSPTSDALDANDDGIQSGSRRGEPDNGS